MYFPDLSEYAYGRRRPKPHILNVGWLSKEHPYLQGAAPAELLLRLAELVRSPVNLYRGSHICEFCPAPPTIISPGGIRMLNPPPETRGNGEIRIRVHKGTVYVAPVLIHHYVAAHAYLPPDEFLEAVKTGVPVLDESEDH
jgi:hypothetical protein